MLNAFKLERYFAKYEFNTRFLLSSSDCESRTIEEILAFKPGSTEKLKKLSLGYIDSKGKEETRHAISSLYQEISSDQILVHSGAEEAIFLFMNAVLSAGDEIIVHSPSYQALSEIPSALDCKVIPWFAREDRGWGLDLQDLRGMISRRTKCIVVNFPHNPTGHLPSREFFVELNKIASENGIILFSDEVYRECEYSAKDRLPAACDLNESAVSLGVLSKTYGLAGLRIGWIATRNKQVLNRMAELKDYTTICNSAPSEFLAEIALLHRDQLVERNLKIIQDNLVHLDRFFSEYEKKVSWIRPKAGPIAFARLASGDTDSFCHEVVTREGVLLLPGSVFGNYPSHFRIGMGRRNLPEALQRLEQYIRLSK